MLICAHPNDLDGLMISQDWSLHPRLAQDGVVIGDLALSQVLLADDANFPWLQLVPRRGDAVDIIDLDEADQAELTREIALVARALKEITCCDKLNIAALGNVVPQLHVHIIARRKTDPAWPRPIWGVLPARPYDPAERDRFVQAVRQKIGAG
jgi:diadenosine tetraphosphate (Ap4A) HIT family hydrolase